MQPCQIIHGGARLSARNVPPLINRSPAAPRASHFVQSSARLCQAQTQGNSVSHPLVLAATVAPLLIPLQAFCQEQAAVEQAAGVTAEVAGLVSSTLAIPVVVFGAVSLLQQARQANEDKQLTLKAINTHNTFMSQEEAEPDQQGIAVPTTMLAHNSEGASTSSASGSQDSRDAPDAAAPAMLDRPDRPEPSLPKAGNSGADTPTEKRKPSELPPQTAVLDRPDRPEPDTASTKSNATAQGSDTAHVAKPQANTVRFAENQTSTRPHSPDTTQQVAALQAEYEAKIKSLKGFRGTWRPSSRQHNHDGQGLVQAADLAAEYAAKLALLHEESAARAEGDERKRQQRSLMLADLQAQAQMSRPASPVITLEPQTQNKVVKFLTAVWGYIMVFLHQLVVRAQNLIGTSQSSADTRSHSQYSRA